MLNDGTEQRFLRFEDFETDNGPDLDGYLTTASPDASTGNIEADFEKIRFWTTPVSNCAQGEGACVPYYRWVSDYIGVIGGR